MNQEKPKYVGVELPPDLYKRLAADAQSTKRSRAAMLRHLIDEFCTKEKDA